MARHRGCFVQSEPAGGPGTDALIPSPRQQGNTLPVALGQHEPCTMPAATHAGYFEHSVPGVGKDAVGKCAIGKAAIGKGASANGLGNPRQHPSMRPDVSGQHEPSLSPAATQEGKSKHSAPGCGAVQHSRVVLPSSGQQAPCLLPTATQAGKLEHSVPGLGSEEVAAAGKS
mmetsp:Transcript_104567/g.337211  ORF Transcript_104567/g.337211 Transcript_104567/m.337211 type:complete len:172 (+) Transcript_104567:165-680(+)